MNEAIRSIRRAGIELSKWAGYATAMIDKIELNELQTPQDYHSCEFGKWYAKDQWNLSSFSEYAQLGIHHVKLHELYEEMMEIIEREVRPSFFKKISGSTPKLSKLDRKLLLNKYQSFKLVSKQALTLLKTLRDKVSQRGLCVAA